MVDIRQGIGSSGRRSFAVESHVWIGAVVVLALALRLLRLDPPLWYGEIDTLVRYVRLPFGELISSYDSLNNHLLFSVLAKLSVGLFGETPWALRLPAVLFGVASVWALWKLAREIVAEEQALLAALLMAVAYHHVWFSQNARGYTGLVFFGLLATLCFVRGLRSKDIGPWLGYGIWFALSMYTHLSSAFLFAAHGIACLLIIGARAIAARGLSIGDLARPAAGALLGLAVTALLYAPVIGQMGDTFGGVRAGPAEVNRVESVAHWQNPFWMIREVVGSLGPLLAPAAPVVLVVLGFAMVSLWKKAAVVPLSFLVHVPLTVVLLMALSFRVWPRYFFVDIGFLCLFLVHGAYVIGGLIGHRMRVDARKAGRTLAALGIAATLVLLPRNYLHPKQDFTGARSYVEAEAGPDAVVVALGLTAMPFVDYYARDWIGAQTLADVDAALSRHPDAWIVYTFPNVLERRHADVFAAIEGRYEKARYFPGTLSDGGIVVLRPVAR